MSVIIYTTPTCGYCHQAKQYLTERGVKYQEYDVSRDQRAAEDMVQKSGQMGVPVIMVDGQVIVGFDRARLEQLLAKGGGGRQRPSFGLRIADASKITQRSGSVPVFGAYVGGVTPGSAGAKLGLDTGDIITEINVKPIRNADDAEQVLATLVQGYAVAVKYVRGDQTLKSEVII